MVVFGHHADGLFQVEIMGREFPNGMTEHALAFAASALVLALIVYGAVAVLRDARRWLSRRQTH
jgi:hydrogenase/urease accessory protein HupE